MKALVTGTVDFIDSHIAKRLLERVDEVVGIGNYDVKKYVLPRNVVSGWS